VKRMVMWACCESALCLCARLGTDSSNVFTARVVQSGGLEMIEARLWLRKLAASPATAIPGDCALVRYYLRPERAPG